MTLDLGCPDFEADPAVIRVVKEEIVAVEFATAAGVLQSAVGPNHFAVGDALLTGTTGDRWCVTRDRFDAKYRPCDGVASGVNGRYRNVPVPVLAKQIHQAFCIARRPGGDVLQGNAGDWAVQYGPADYGCVERARFALVYRVMPATGR